MREREPIFLWAAGAAAAAASCTPHQRVGLRCGAAILFPLFIPREREQIEFAFE